MTKPEVIVVDNYLSDPDLVRSLALRQTFAESMWHKGKRSEPHYGTVDPTDLEKYLGLRIDDFRKHGMNSRFQLCLSGEQIVYHSDLQSYAAILFLTPNAPIEAGVSFWRSKITGLRFPSSDSALTAKTYEGNLLDPTKWELVDRIGNIYNRLVIWNGQLVHSPSAYFGTDLQNGRLFQIFFFDAV